MNIAKINNDVCTQLQLGKISDKANIRFVLQKRDKTLFAEGYYTQHVGVLKPRRKKNYFLKYFGLEDMLALHAWAGEAIKILTGRAGQ